MNIAHDAAVERKTHYRSDYKKSIFALKNAELNFKLHETETVVESTLLFEKTQVSAQVADDLVLNGENLHLVQIQLNGDVLSENQYAVENDTLVIFAVPSKFVLETVVRIDPQNNKTLNGLYLSNGNFTTQCEPHGFRCITYFLDRPDVLTNFTVKITADKEKYPVLLSNGNLMGSGDLDDGQHWVLWQDPTLKPCYLFALVAGGFECASSKFVTMSNKEVDLKVYVEKGKLDQAEFALDALRRAMLWDEQVYQREYELDIYMIVAVADFNFGAMENKGLNIFNDQYVLANSALATDQDYTNVLGVVGHEYFHNWSGNRVTCRDWFQLSLKEGLTIFRDQSFTADMTSAISKRISDVYIMKNCQFAEDAGPMSHPIRPDSYVSMNNFYTNTVYNKGAEVIRMIETILGKEAFGSGMDEYFRANDGLAVTTDDFVTAMEVASGVDLSQFRLWYSQSGTPDVSVAASYDSVEKT
ncbi:MAG: aminopeptidase N, partial [Legionellales bacterium]|nr:aminopeptidase N [Legionellales bacterium]